MASDGARDRQILIQRIDALLPQTQCRQCGYDGCAPYARAVASGEADINQCPPGGEAGVAALAAALDVPAKPLDPARGETKPPRVARIREADCIGCTLCIRACPVDAIIGATRHLHAVLPDACSGCELCIAPCPVDCIDLVPAPWDDPAGLKSRWRARHDARRERLDRQAREKQEKHARRLAAHAAHPDDSAAPAASRKSAIQALLEKARQKQQQMKSRAGTPPATEDDPR